MSSHQIRFCSFQDTDFVFEVNTPKEPLQNINPANLHDILDFCLSFQRFNWIQSSNSPPIPQTLLQQSASIEFNQRIKHYKSRHKQTIKSPCLSDIKPQKIRITKGNKFEKQVEESPLAREINCLRHEIVSSFTRIELELDKETEKSMEKSFEQSIVMETKKKMRGDNKSINSSFNRSMDKSFTRSVKSKQTESSKTSRILTSRTPKSPLKQSNTQIFPKPSISKKLTPKMQKKQNSLQPVSIRLSIRNISDQSPTSLFQPAHPKQPTGKFQIANNKPQLKHKK